MLTVYHGSCEEIRRPLVKAGRPYLDFGQGFYVTDIRLQAERWAFRMELMRGKRALLNIYELDIERVYARYRVLKFEHYDKEWLDFIVANRSGNPMWKNFDLVEGGVANDRVIDTIEAYMIGNITLKMALGQLAQYRPNNQICLLNQEMTDECLHFLGMDWIKNK